MVGCTVGWSAKFAGSVNYSESLPLLVGCSRPALVGGSFAVEPTDGAPGAVVTSVATVVTDLAALSQKHGILQVCCSAVACASGGHDGIDPE